MKLRYLFSMILAALFFVGCVDEMGTDSFENIKLDKTMLVIPVEGGSVELKINATEAWAFDTLYTEDVWPNVIKREKNKETGVETVTSVDPSWLAVNIMAGEAGENVVKFTADKVDGGREIELCIKAGINSQFVKIRQGSLEASSATCAEVIAGPDGKTYRVKGVCTGIANTTYGNWYLDDGTGEVYVYGTLDKDGKTKNYESWGMEVGDVVEVEGPKLTYGSTIELVDVTVISIEKSLLKIITEETIYEKEGGEFNVKVAFKGEGLYPTVDKDSKSWVSIVGVDTYPGNPTKIEPNPADTAIVTFAISEYMEKAAPRKGAIILKSSNDDGATEMTYTITQKGLIPDPTPIKDATKVGEGICVEGTVVALCSQGYILNDGTGNILIYHPEEGWECNVVIGDKVMAAAEALGAYNFSAQLKTPYFEEKVSEKPEEVKYPEAVLYDAAKLDEVIGALKDTVDPANKEKEIAIKVEYATMIGKLTIDGKYHNVEIAGSPYQGSLYNPLESLKLADYKDKVVALSGYFLSVSQSSGAFKFANLVVTSVKDAGDYVFPELSFSKTEDTVAPEATEYSFDIKSNLKWSLTASEGVTLDKTSGEGNATVKMTFAANTTDAAIVHTVTAKADGASDKVLKVTQASAAAPTVATAAEINAAEDDENKLYEVTGYITEVVNDKYGNIYIQDATGSVYVYGTLDAEGNGANWSSLNIKAGDIVTVVGPKVSYKGSPQMKNVTVKDHKPVATKTVEEFLAAPESKEVYYRLTGKVSKIANTTYGNFDIVDETGSVYVYGLLSGWGGPSKMFESLGLVEGDIVTLVGVRSAYKGTAQVGSAFYVSHEKGAPAADPWETAVSYDLPESASSSRQVLRNVKYYADADNINIRLVASISKAEEKTDGLTISFYDKTNGTAGKGFYGWWNNAIGDVEYNAERCGAISGSDLTLTVGEETVDVQKVVDGDLVTWTFAFPRSANAVLAGEKVYMGILTLDAEWNATGAMPDKYADMLEVTLP